MSETKILVPYDEYTAMVKDSADLESITGLLHTDFPDNTSQILACLLYTSPSPRD